jgi:organic hydroperoxide reductase OsmC/OhrA
VEEERLMSNVAAGVTAGPQVVYQSRVRVEPGAAKLKLVQLPHEADPIPMGVHGPIAAHYKIDEGTFIPHAATLDFIVGATAGCLIGTFNGALQARQIATDEGRLIGEAVGDVEVEDGVLVIRRIRMIVRVRADPSQRAAVERVAEVYAPRCPVYRSLRNAIGISTELQFEAEAL